MNTSLVGIFADTVSKYLPAFASNFIAYHCIISYICFYACVYVFFAVCFAVMMSFLETIPVIPGQTYLDGSSIYSDFLPRRMIRRLKLIRISKWKDAPIPQEQPTTLT